MLYSNNNLPVVYYLALCILYYSIVSSVNWSENLKRAGEKIYNYITTSIRYHIESNQNAEAFKAKSFSMIREASQAHVLLEKCHLLNVDEAMVHVTLLHKYDGPKYKNEMNCRKKEN